MEYRNSTAQHSTASTEQNSTRAARMYVRIGALVLSGSGGGRGRDWAVVSGGPRPGGGYGRGGKRERACVSVNQWMRVVETRMTQRRRDDEKVVIWYSTVRQEDRLWGSRSIKKRKGSKMERLISACTTHGERARDREEADADVDVRMRGCKVRRLRLRPTRGTQDLSLTQRKRMRQDQTRKAASGRPEYEKDGIQQWREGRRQEMDTKGTAGKATDG